MSYSMNINKSKKIIAIATVITTISCLAPESAQARLRFSGTSNFPGIDIQSFVIDTTIQDSNTDVNVGIFDKAIQIFEIQFVDPDGQFIPVEPFRLGKLKASQVLPSDLMKFGLTFENLINEPSTSDIFEKFQNGGLKYESTFNNNSVKFTFFVPLPDPSEPFTEANLINSLSDLERYLQTLGANEAVLPGIVEASPPWLLDTMFVQGYGLSCRTGEDGAFPAAPDNSDLSELCSNFPLDSGAGPIKIVIEPVTKAPEPSTIASLLSFGALGTASLLKRTKHSK